jgi:L-alanine-DL-glutamate epimerase-like enolase superfamily enzyme
MKIHDLELFSVAAGSSGSPEPERTLLVRVITASGLEGWGESGLTWRPSELAARRESLRAVLAGRSVFDIEELHLLEALGPSPVRSAVEMAVWDLLGRVLHQPLCNLLGGYYRRRIPVAARLTACRPKTAGHVSRELAEQGFHTQTLVTGGRADDDIQTIAAIRELLGDRIEIRLDAQGRFNAETARDLCAGLELEHLQFLLDPLDTTELHPVAILGRQTTVPLAVRRAIRSPADVMIAVRCNAAHCVLIDLEQVGGIISARACAAVAAAAGVSPILSSRASLGPAAAAAIHLAAATSSLAASNEIAPEQLRHTLLTGGLEIADGMIAVPDAPGLGVEIDRAKVERRQPIS